MKKLKSYISLLIICTLICSLLPSTKVSAASNTIPTVSSYAYILMDANSGEIILDHNPNKKIYPASTAKLMTAIVAIESSKSGKSIKTNKTILSKVPKDASKLNLPAGVTYSFSNLLHMLLIASAADAAETLAAGTYGSTSKFIKAMNQKAKKLSMSHTSFDNTMGLDIGNNYKKTYTTASDFSLLARYAMSNDTIRTIVAKNSYVIPKTSKTAKKTIKSTNLFYSTASYSKDLYTIIGTKTGTTNAAGSVLIATAVDDDGHEVICAFFGNAGRTKLYQDVRKLFDYTFTSYQNGTLSLTKGFYDTRYTEYSDLIHQYYEEGLISGNSNGEFKPNSKVTQKSFIATVNKISSGNLSTIDEDKKITVLDFANILYNTYPQTISDTDYEKLVTKIEKNSSKELKEADKKALAILYNSNLLPDDFSYNCNTYLTKENMIVIADHMITFLDNYIPIIDIEANTSSTLLKNAS